MSKTGIIHMRVEPELKDDAEYILEQLGMSTTEAINIFLKQLVLTGGLPFTVKLPEYNEETKEAFKEAKKISKCGKGYSIDSLFEELEKE